MTDTKTTRTPAHGQKLPPGYRLEFSESGIGIGGMWTAYGPGNTDLGACGGGSGKNADKVNARRAAELCYADFGRKAVDLLAACRALTEATEMLGPPALRAARDLAFRAIAKAEGGAA